MARTVSDDGATEMRILELARLDRLTERAWELMEGADDDEALKAIDRIVQIS